MSREDVLSRAADPFPAPSSLIVDVRNLSFIGACAYTALARKAEQYRQRGLSPGLISCQPIVGRIVAVCGLHEILPIYQTVEDAMDQPHAAPRRR
jgi:anti-anti-sigma factor